MRVEIHDDHFEDDEADEVWLPEVGRRRWVVLSKDANIRKRDLQRRALKKARVHAFFLGRADLSGSEMAEIFRRAVPRIIKLISQSKSPVIGVIQRNSSVNVIEDEGQDAARKKRRKSRRKK